MSTSLKTCLLVFGAFTVVSALVVPKLSVIKHHQVTIDWYEVLGVDSKAEHGEIVKAYYKRSVETHPDGHPSEERDVHEEEFVKIHDALHVLGVKDRRERFDSGVQETSETHLLHTRPRKEAFENADKFFKDFSKRYSDGTEVHLQKDGVLMVDFSETNGKSNGGGEAKEIKEDLKHVFVTPSTMPPLIDDTKRAEISHDGISLTVKNLMPAKVEIKWHAGKDFDKAEGSQVLAPEEEAEVLSQDAKWWSATVLVEGKAPRQIRRWMVDARFGVNQSVVLKGDPKTECVLANFVNKYDRHILLRQQGFFWGVVQAYESVKGWSMAGDEWELHDSDCDHPGTEACILRSFRLPSSMGPSLSIDMHPDEEDNMKGMEDPPEATDDGVRRVRATVINRAGIPLVVHASRGLKAVLPAGESSATFNVRALDRIWVEEGKTTLQKQFVEQTIDGDTVGKEDWAVSSPPPFCEAAGTSLLQVSHVASTTGPRPGLSGCQARCEELLGCSAVEYFNDTTACSSLLANCRDRAVEGSSRDAHFYRFAGRRPDTAVPERGPGRVLKVWTSILAKGLNQWIHVLPADPGCAVTFRNKMPFRVRLVTSDALRWGILAPGHEAHVWAHAGSQWHSQDDEHEPNDVLDVYTVCTSTEPMTVDIERYSGPPELGSSYLKEF